MGDKKKENTSITSAEDALLAGTEESNDSSDSEPMEIDLDYDSDSQTHADHFCELDHGVADNSHSDSVKQSRSSETTSSAVRKGTKSSAAKPGCRQLVRKVLLEPSETTDAQTEKYNYVWGHPLPHELNLLEAPTSVDAKEVSATVCSMDGGDTKSFTSPHGSNNSDLDTVDITGSGASETSNAAGKTDAKSSLPVTEDCEADVSIVDHDYGSLEVLRKSKDALESSSEEETLEIDDSLQSPNALHNSVSDSCEVTEQRTKLPKMKNLDQREIPKAPVQQKSRRKVLSPAFVITGESSSSGSEKKASQTPGASRLSVRNSSSHGMRTRSTPTTMALDAASKAMPTFVAIASKPPKVPSAKQKEAPVPITSGKSGSSRAAAQVLTLPPQMILPPLHKASDLGQKAITLTSPTGAVQTVYLVPVSVAANSQGSSPVAVPGPGKVTLTSVSQSQVGGKGLSGAPVTIPTAHLTQVTQVSGGRTLMVAAPKTQLAVRKIAPAPVSGGSKTGAGSVNSTEAVAVVPAAAVVQAAAAASTLATAAAPASALPSVTAAAVVAAAGRAIARTSVTGAVGTVASIVRKVPVTTVGTSAAVGTLAGVQQSVPATSVAASATTTVSAGGAAQVPVALGPGASLLTPTSQPNVFVLMPTTSSSAVPSKSSQKVESKSTTMPAPSSSAVPGKVNLKVDPKSAAVSFKSSVDVNSMSQLIQRKNPVPMHRRPYGDKLEEVFKDALVCLECGDMFCTQTGLDSHLARISMVIRFNCDRCRRILIFHNKCILLQHLRQHQEDKNDANKPTLSVAITNNSISIKSFPEDHMYLKRHMWQNPAAESGSALCLECHASFRSTEVLAQHFNCTRVLVDTSYFCSVCMQYLPSPCAFSAHKRMHLMLPPWVCPDCGVEVVGGFRELLVHMMSVCSHFYSICAMKCQAPGCSKMHGSRRELIRHLLHVHGRPYYKCQQCFMAFNQVESLQQHHRERHATQATLTSTLIYRCILCNFSTNNKSKYEEHMRDHVKGDEVSICRQLRCLCCWARGKLYSISMLSRSTLLTHCWKDHGSDKQTCALCSKTFPGLCALLQHQVEKHMVRLGEPFHCFPCKSCRHFFAFASLREQHLCQETYAPRMEEVGDSGSSLQAPEQSYPEGDVQILEEPPKASSSSDGPAEQKISEGPASSGASSSASQPQLATTSVGVTMATSQGSVVPTTSSCSSLVVMTSSSSSLASTSGSVAKTPVILTSAAGISGLGRSEWQVVLNGAPRVLFCGEPRGVKRKLEVKTEAEEEEDPGEMDASAVLVCRMCFTSIKGKASLIEHVVQHQEEGMAVCRHCQRTDFADLAAVAAHEEKCALRIRVREKPKPKEEKPKVFPCHLCGLIYTEKRSHDAHLETAHQTSRKTLPCSLCSRKGSVKTFSRAELLERHLLTHRIAKTQVKELMQTALQAAAEAACHSQTGRDAPEVNASETEGSVKKLRVAELGTYTCAKCGFQSEEKETFTQHIQQHYKAEDGTLCPECGMCYAVLPSLRKHLALVHKVQDVNRYILNLGHDEAVLANDNVPSKEDGSSDAHSEDGILECKVCYRQFGSSAQLKTHMRTHGMAFIRSRRFSARSAKSNSTAAAAAATKEEAGDKQVSVKLERLDADDAEAKVTQAEEGGVRVKREILEEMEVTAEAGGKDAGGKDAGGNGANGTGEEESEVGMMET